MPQPEKITAEQAAAALEQVLAGNGDDEIQEAKQEPEEPAPAQEEPAAEETPAEQPATETEQAAAETDDVASLKQRLAQERTEKETLKKNYEDRVHAIRERSAQNERIRQDKFLRKSSVLDRARQLIEAAKAGDGVSVADADRVLAEIGGTANPASASYAPPPQPVSEDSVTVVNSFMNEMEMSRDEEVQFGNWMRGEAANVLTAREQELAGRDLDGFLRLAHTRFRAGLSEQDKKTKRDEVIGAVRSVQQTQRQAARAASTPSAAPRKQSTGQKVETDLRKLPKSQQREAVAALLKASVEEYH